MKDFFSSQVLQKVTFNMPQHTLKGSPALKIELVRPPGDSYAPGDIITGHLIRRLPIVTPSATVVLVLEGRSKTKITRKSGNSRSVYRDRWKIVDVGVHLYKGPLNMAEGSTEPLIWPCSLQIPLEPTVTNVRYDSKGSFLPQDTSHPIHHVLPGSFYGADNSVFGSYESHSFVEYFLKAELRYSHGDKYHMEESICPITMRHSIPVGAMQQLALSKTLSTKNEICSQRLLPGMDTSDLSFRQHAQKLFHTSKVPRFCYAVRLTVPMVIRLSDPTPLPLSLEVVQDPKTSDSIKDVAQTIEILEFHATLKGKTVDRALSDVLRMEETNSYTQKTALSTQLLIANLKSPLTITTGKMNEPIHLGNMFQLTLGPNGLRSEGKPVATTYGPSLGRSIYPDMTTHNIHHHHRMEWKVKLKIARETETHEFTTGVQIFG